ncbi:MAG: hypothetical protein ACRDAM_01150, partial [Casimicrobium sp.]
APDLAPISWIPGNITFEEESGRSVIELGILGWLLGLALRGALLVWAIHHALYGASKSVRAVGMMTLPVMASALHSGIGVFASPVWSAYVWFCVCCLCMAEYEHRVDRARSVGGAKINELDAVARLR